MKKDHFRKLKHIQKANFLKYLKRGWTISKAARQADIPIRSLYDWREADEEFLQNWDDALSEGTDTLEEEASRRAFQGTLKPVYQQGRRVGTVREYSDQLAALILKKRNPAFKERHEHSGTGKDGSFLVTIGERESKV